MDCAKRDKLANNTKLFRQTGLLEASFLPKRDPGNELGSRNVERALITQSCVVDLFTMLRFSDFFIQTKNEPCRSIYLGEFSKYAKFYKNPLRT